MPKPEMELGSADFARLLENKRSNSVYPLGNNGVATLQTMSRLLLSPNLVLESSRSSLAEADTIGPVGATTPDPYLDDALGKPVSIALSSLLLEKLVSLGTTIMTPAMQRSWLCEDADKPCPRSSWVERVLIAKAQSAKNLPTALLAVRELGITSRRISVIAAQGEDGMLRFRPRRSLTEYSVCPDTTLRVPAVIFSAEVVSADGRLVARIHEERTPEVKAQRDEIEFVEWRAVRRLAHAKVRFDKRPLKGSEYYYVKRWRRKNVSCGRALDAYLDILQEIEQTIAIRLPDIASQILNDSLGRLYPAVPQI